jgi:hypothetical protein
MATGANYLNGRDGFLFTVGNGPLYWEYSSQAVLVLNISKTIHLLLLCSAIGMLWSDLYLLHVCGGLFMY